MKTFKYEREKTQQISFPLGGIGAGCIGLAGDGRLVDWEISNRPNKGSLNGFSHFAIKAEQCGKLLDARALHGDLQPPFTGEAGARMYQGIGFGPSRHTVAGAPHFARTVFHGGFPLARVEFLDKGFPGRVTLTAFNPFIPLNDKDSSIPAAFFEFEIANTTKRPLDYTLALTLQNPHAVEGMVNSYTAADGRHTVTLGNEALEANSPQAGALAMATDVAAVSCQQYWYRGRWFDALGVFWRDFTTPGPLKPRVYAPHTAGDSRVGYPDHATLAAHVSVAAGAMEKVRFVIAWHFPTCENNWNPVKCDGAGGNCCQEAPARNTWRNYYATLFPDVDAVAAYSMQNWRRLYDETVRFQKTLFASTVPDCVLDAVSANISILKSPTCLRLEDGSFYGWEGCHAGAGCCEGTCTHVWGYAYALPFLFPQLERSARNNDFKYNMREDGRMSFRLQLPLGRPRSDHRACADGQFGGVMRVYRDWKISGDDAWLRGLWPQVKKAVEYAWAETNEDRWDSDRDGVLEGRQHHTLDMELFGPNAWLTGMYLGALKAAAEMANFCDDPGAGEYYRALFAQGKAYVDEQLFNGEYYYQQIDLNDRGIIEAFGDEARQAYWSEEHGEIKYQIGEGCGVDQVLAQWHANLCGLGEVLAPKQVRKALRAIYKHNFKSMRGHFNPCRLYCLNDEKGLVICEWPAGRYKPVVPVPYSEETMHGFEYQAACHMIQEGLVDEGLDVVAAVRDRYDGCRRNPWNEFECGSNYARSMASYALLPALAGFQYDLSRGMVGFNPVKTKATGAFRCFWSLGSGWGMFEWSGKTVTIDVRYGQLVLRELRLPFAKGQKLRSVRCGADKPAPSLHKGCLHFDEPVLIKPDSPLTIRFTK